MFAVWALPSPARHDKPEVSGVFHASWFVFWADCVGASTLSASWRSCHVFHATLFSSSCSMLANILVQAPKQARRYCVLGRRRSWAAGACHYRHCVAPTLRIPCFIILVQGACRSLELLSPVGTALAWTGATFFPRRPHITGLGRKSSALRTLGTASMGQHGRPWWREIGPFSTGAQRAPRPTVASVLSRRPRHDDTRALGITDDPYARI